MKFYRNFLELSFNFEWLELFQNLNSVLSHSSTRLLAFKMHS